MQEVELYNNKTICESKDLMNCVTNNLTVKQMQLILLLGSQVHELDNELNQYNISISELCDIFNVDKSKPDRRNKLIDELKKLASKIVTIQEEHITTITGWVSMIKVNEADKTVSIKLADWLHEYFIDIPTDKKLIYRIEHIFRLRQKSAINLYRWAYSKNGFDNTVKIKIDEAKTIFHGTDNIRTCDFIKDKLKPAIEEINNKTDLIIKVKPIKAKGSRSYTSLEFSINSKDSKKIKAFHELHENEKILDVLKSYGLIFDDDNIPEGVPESFAHQSLIKDLKHTIKPKYDNNKHN